MMITTNDRIALSTDTWICLSASILTLSFSAQSTNRRKIFKHVGTATESAHKVPVKVAALGL